MDTPKERIHQALRKATALYKDNDFGFTLFLLDFIGFSSSDLTRQDAEYLEYQVALREVKLKAEAPSQLGDALTSQLGDALTSQLGDAAAQRGKDLLS